MLVAQVWGLVRFVLDLVYPAPRCGTADERPSMLIYVHEYYHSVSQIFLAGIVAAIISVLTEPLSSERVSTTYR